MLDTREPGFLSTIGQSVLRTLGNVVGVRPGEKVPLAARVAVILLFLVAALAWFVAYKLTPTSGSEWASLVPWIALGLVAHAGEFDVPKPGRFRTFVSAGFAVSAAAIVSLPMPVAMIAVALGSVTINQLRNSVNPVRSFVLNRSLLGVASLVGSVAFTFVHSLPFGADIVRLGISTGVASLFYAVANLGLVGIMLAVYEGRPFGRSWLSPFGSSRGLFLNFLALGLLGDLIVILLRVAGPAGLLLAVLPIVVSYFSLRQTAQIIRLNESIVLTLVDSLDLRDRDTGGHTRRVAALSVRLGKKLGLRGEQLSALRTSAYLHDLGKIGIPDAILLKPGKLSAEEWTLMRQHPALGADLLKANGLLQSSVDMILHHHERYDGLGYPAGLAAEKIPFGARIITVVDSFTAMVDGRPYRAPRPVDEALEELKRNAATQFDPLVVRVLTKEDWEAVVREIPQTPAQRGIVAA